MGKKEKPGDGRPLKRYRPWQQLWRSVFGIEHRGARWDVDVDFFDWDGRVALYRDGRQDRSQKLPAAFELEDGSRIEVAVSSYGMRRAHLVTPEGRETQLAPAPGTLERRRADLHRTRPGLSHAISALSFLVLVAVIVIQLPQGAQWLGETTGWYDFASPWSLDGTANTVIVVAGFVALIERALRMRYSWWLDGLEGLDGLGD